MKKYISFILCICMIFTMSVVSFAEDENFTDMQGSDVEEWLSDFDEDTIEGIVMAVSYDTEKGTSVDKYTVFHEGWSEAIEKSKDENYKNVTVTLKQNWVSDDDGRLNPDIYDDRGFNLGAINITDGCNITIDLNGYKIDRKLTECIQYGEVICINNGATVVIKNGTITGGFSSNGAGGILIFGGNVTLENVNVIGNKIEDDDGAGIAMHSGDLVMNGGSISDNEGTVGNMTVSGGGIAVVRGEATLNGVTISNNYIHGGEEISNYGAGVFVNYGTTYLNDCIIENNNTSGDGGAIFVMSMEGQIYLDECEISGNTAGWDGSAIYVKRGFCKVTNSNIYDNVNKEGEHSIYLMFGELELDNYYLDDEIKNLSGILNPGSRLEEPLTLSGSMISNNNTIAIVFGAIAVVVVAGAFVFAKKKKSVNNSEE